MKYLSKYESHEKIHDICRIYNIDRYRINKDGSIDVDNYVDLENVHLVKLPLKFRNVSGGFNCVDSKLTSLEGCPKFIDGGFSCRGNLLTNLKGCPKSVNGYFFCSENKLTSLEGCVNICETFSCSYNRLTSLRGCPKSVGGDFNCLYNNIDTFEGLDFVHIGGNFCCNMNPIWEIWNLFIDYTKFEFFNDCDIIREDQVIILDRLNFFLDYINKPTVDRVWGYKCI